jgi:hypothetical protein
MKGVGMLAHGGGTRAFHLHNHLLFAREPDPDLEFHDAQGTEPSQVFGSPEKSPNRSSRVGALILVLLLVVIAGGTYLASDPGFILDLIGQGAPSAPPSAPPVVEPGERAPVAEPSAPVPAPLLEPSAVPAPLFSEGQQVTINQALVSSMGTASLSVDAQGTRLGPSVRPGAALTVLDAELQNNIWIYSVRTEEGATGWISEMRLTPK